MIITFHLHTGAHRALPDVLAMEAIFTHRSLASCLSNLNIHLPKQQLSLWIRQKRTFQRTTALTRSLGKPSITKDQAKRLDILELGYDDLVKMRSECSDGEVFSTVLKNKGVNSKPLRGKLIKLVPCCSTSH